MIIRFESLIKFCIIVKKTKGYGTMETMQVGWKKNIMETMQVGWKKS